MVTHTFVKVVRKRSRLKGKKSEKIHTETVQ